MIKQLAFLTGKLFIAAAATAGFVMLLFRQIIPSLLEPPSRVVVAYQGNPLYSSWWFEPLVLGIWFGVCVALTGGPLHYFQVRKIAQGKPFDLSPEQHRTIRLAINPAKAFELCILALERLPSTVIEKNTATNYLAARTKAGWKSWGDDIKIEIMPAKDATVKIQITCQPTIWTAMVDYGRNYEHAEKLLSILSEAQHAA